jgi:glutamate dehydrogenase (NAD(P)+)
VAIGEWDGTVCRPQGIDIDALQAHRQKTGSIRDFPGARTLAKASDCLEVECDILVPAALENQIHRGNASRVQARLVAEAANGPTTPEAEAHLLARGVSLLPDLFLNAGGVTVSYFEWSKNLSHMRLGRLEKRRDETYRSQLLDATEALAHARFPTDARDALLRGSNEEDLVNSGLEETMVTAYNEIRDVLRRYPKVADLRTAAYILAIEKVGQSYLDLGVFP